MVLTGCKSTWVNEHIVDPIVELFDALFKKRKEKLYNSGVEYLENQDYRKASEIFGNKRLKGYKDTSKKYNYSINLQRYEQHAYTYENLIDYGLREEGSIAKVDFDTEGGEAIARKSIEKKQEGSYITEVAVKEHYDFSHWNLNYAGYEKATDSIRYLLEASYKQHSYNITYELGGGDTTERLPKTYGYNCGSVSIPNVSKAGYDFVGYQSNLYEDVRKDFVIPNGTAKDITLTAKYASATYHISFDAGEGVENPDPVDVTYGEDVTSKFPTVVKDYHTFDYWMYNGEQVDLTSWSIKGDVTLVAHYTPAKYNITYKLHDATDPGLPTSYNYGDRIALPYVEKANAIFIGWKIEGSAAIDPEPEMTIGYTDHEDKVIEAIFVDATIDENSKLLDLIDKDVKNVVIPSFVTDISVDLVYQMPNLLRFYIDSKNEHFSLADTDDRLLIKDKHIAFAYPTKFSGHNLTLPDEVDEVGVNAFRGTEIIKVYGSAFVTKLNDRAFYNCTSLDLCDLTNVNYVGNSAFENTKVNEGFLDDNASTLVHIGDYAFKRSKVSEIDINNNVTHIGTGAFSFLEGVTSVNFYPNKECYIGGNVFTSCENLKTLTTDSMFLDTLVSTALGSVDLTTINLTGSSNISNGICLGNTTLKTLDLSSSTINQIGVNSFKGDTSLETVILPSTLKRIKAGAFSDCAKLDDVNFDELPDLFQIEGEAFKGAKFSELDFSHNSHLTIEDHAFTSCRDLTSITMNHGQIVTRMADVFDLCGEITSVTYCIPETDSDIIVPNYLFEDLNNVTSITFSYLGSDDKEISFGSGAFKNCASLVDIKMDNCHVTSISRYCFEGCVAFTNEDETFSELIRYEAGAFYGCVNLDTMSFSTDTVYIGKDAFAGCYSLLADAPLLIERNDALVIGLGAFADLTGELQFDYTADEISSNRSTFNKWYHFDDGFSGVITPLRS